MINHGRNLPPNSSGITVEIVDRVGKRSVSATHHFGTNSVTFLQYSNKGAVPMSTILLRVVFNTKASPDISQSYFTNVE